MDCLISVIVPVYKVEPFLARCVVSILAQPYESLQIILVDDGSPDSCPAICEEYAARDSRVQVIHKENGGLSSARNAGLEAARGEYLSFVDSDDWIEPDTYEAMLALALETGVKLVCAGRFDVSQKTGQKTVGLCPPRREVISGEELAGRIFTWDQVDSAAWDKLYHRSLFRERRYPVGVIVEDVPVTYGIALEAGRAAMLNKPVYNYFHRKGSITNAPVSEKTFHFSRHTARILSDIEQNHPGLLPQARYLRVRSLTYNLLTLENAGPEDRQRFSRVYRESLAALRKLGRFVLTGPFFGRQERLTALLLAAGLYRPMRVLYRILKPNHGRNG